MKTRQLTGLSAAIGLAVLLQSCGGGTSPDPKSLGFSDVDEMKSIQAQGWHTKQKFAEDQRLLEQDKQYEYALAQMRKAAEEAKKKDEEAKKIRLAQEMTSRKEAEKKAKETQFIAVGEKLGASGIAKCQAALLGITMIYAAEEKYRKIPEVADMMKEHGMYERTLDFFDAMQDWVGGKYGQESIAKQRQAALESMSNTGNITTFTTNVRNCANTADSAGKPTESDAVARADASKSSDDAKAASRRQVEYACRCYGEALQACATAANVRECMAIKWVPGCGGSADLCTNDGRPRW